MSETIAWQSGSRRAFRNVPGAKGANPPPNPSDEVRGMADEESGVGDVRRLMRAASLARRVTARATAAVAANVATTRMPNCAGIRALPRR
jgi:hypothetical protein